MKISVNGLIPSARVRKELGNSKNGTFDKKLVS
jgi:hypothetical protein